MDLDVLRSLVTHVAHAARATAVLRGGAVGFAVAAPLGPIGVLVVQRSLAGGRALGFVTGLGAAVADALYAVVGALATALVARLVAATPLFEIAGGAVLGVLAVKTWRASPAPPITGAPTDPTTTPRVPPRLRWARAFAGALLLTLSNPATALSFAAVSAGVGVASAPSVVAALTFAAGVFGGSALWWFLLSGGVALWRSRFGVGARALGAIGVGSAGLLAGFAIAAVVHAAARP